MTRKEAQLRVAHVVWGYLGGGVDSVLDSYLMADVLRPESVISHVVVIRKPGTAEQKTPKASGGYSLIEHGVQALWQAARLPQNAYLTSRLILYCCTVLTQRSSICIAQAFANVAAYRFQLSWEVFC